MLLYLLVICTNGIAVVYAANHLQDFQTASWNKEVCWCVQTAVETLLMLTGDDGSSLTNQHSAVLHVTVDYLWIISC